MEQAVWTRVDAGNGVPLDMMTARFVHHRFAPHTHEEYSIGVCFEGVEVIDYRGTRHHAGPGSVVVVEPNEVHTGSAAGPTGFAYRVLYPLWSMLSVDDPPHFRDLVFDDPELAADATRTHLLLSQWRDPLEAESRLQWLLAKLVHRHAVNPPRLVRTAGDAVARAAMDRLAGNILNPPSLQQIAADLGLSRFQLLRAFRETIGMPPYAWLSQYRVGRARLLLADGYRPAQAATMTGFADQAHLTRWFRRVVGVTPGAFRNSVQDRRLSRLRS
ncbi:helix-turn-helix domain-containing protein [Actinocrispum wychmicini]|uniref:helix-turn-helix domain-containing protein n=1 Tax=Actinocrispum wychmicini TaxID=1213861 RepID=UPI001A9FF7EC|nr:AraC family transcriptional regulator [Actinocrispum wychmicini]